jgi:hypothetical protein
LKTYLSEKSQTQKEKYCIYSIYEVSRIGKFIGSNQNRSYGGLGKGKWDVSVEWI